MLAAASEAWPAHEYSVIFKARKHDLDPTRPPASLSSFDEAVHGWTTAAEDLFALEAVNFASECDVLLKNLAQFLAAGPLLLLLAVTSDPFQPQRFLVVTTWALLIAVSVGLLLAQREWISW